MFFLMKLEEIDNKQNTFMGSPEPWWEMQGVGFTLTASKSRLEAGSAIHDIKIIMSAVLEHVPGMIQAQWEFL